MRSGKILYPTGQTDSDVDMKYVLHVAKVVSGILLAGAMYSSTTTDLYPGRLFLEAVALTLGVAVAVHGLFTGIETAVTAPSEDPDPSE